MLDAPPAPTVTLSIRKVAPGLYAAFPASKLLLLGNPCSIDDVFTREVAID